MGHAYANYFIKTYIVCYRKMQKTKHFTVSFPRKKSPLKFLKNATENQTLSIPYLLQAQPALAVRLLACYSCSSTLCRRNGLCLNHNQTDS